MLSAIIPVVLAFSLSAGTDAAANPLTPCMGIQDRDARLSCYDAWALQLKTPSSDIRTEPSATPTPTVLASELRVRRERQDFSLTLQGFLTLIRMAQLEDGGNIQIMGWKRNAQQYTLWLDLHGGTPLVFRFYADANTPVSVLEPVVTAKGIIDPELFIMTIAAMAVTQ